MKGGYQDEEPGLGSLFERLIDNLSALLRAELTLFRARALYKLDQSRTALLMLAITALLFQAALTTLLIMSAIALARCVGPLGAGAIVMFIALGVCTMLTRYALRRLASASQISATPKQEADSEETQA